MLNRSFAPVLALQSKRLCLVVGLTVVHGEGVVALGDGGLVARAAPGEREVVHGRWWGRDEIE
jgi:hypothetical protein